MLIKEILEKSCQSRKYLKLVNIFQKFGDTLYGMIFGLIICII